MTRKRSPEARAAGVWKAFYQSPEGKAAIAVLFEEYGFFTTPVGDSTVMIRATGQRDVLVRIAQLIGMRSEQAPRDFEDHEDLLTKMMRQSPHV